MTETALYAYFMRPWPMLIGSILVSAIVLFFIRFMLFSGFRKLTKKTPYKLDNLVLDALSLPVTICTITALIVIFDRLLSISGLLPHEDTEVLTIIIKVLFILAVIIFFDRLFNKLLNHYGDTSTSIKTSKPIIQGTTRTIVFFIGILILLSTLGISITPIVASLGIGSLAVALALQPTLENFFSGMQLVADKPIRVGDFIELESGQQGFVEKIGWRSTWIKMLPNNMLVLPNVQLSKSRIINYFYPEKELSVPVEVGVHYDSDLEHVEKVTLEVARDILVSHEWGVDDYNTFVIFHTFDSSSINFTVMLRAKEYFNRFWVKSAFIKALHKRFAEEGIVIPYPIRAINTTQEIVK